MPSWAYSTAGTTTSIYEAANRLTTGTGASTYTSDADGNTLTRFSSGGGRSKTWNSQNRIVHRSG